MHETIDDRNVREIRPLVPPRVAREEHPLSERGAEVVAEARGALRNILHGQDRRRLAVVVGPCSIHDPDLAIEYAQRLQPLAEKNRDDLLLIMRTYFEKPRTAVGWKGFLNDPHLDGRCDISEGIRRARKLLRTIVELGVPCASELLDPISPQYLTDFMSWGVIGARTTESQVHRALASGLSMPIAFKNGTEGSIEAAVNAMTSAAKPHSFLGIDAEGRSAVIDTQGNSDRHLVLRGAPGRPNYFPEDVARAAKLAAGEGVARPVMVDCSHDNSGKQHERQGVVCRAVLEQIRQGQPALMGLLLESNLEPGRQDWMRGRELRRGVSITDACIGFPETEDLLGEIAESVRSARGASRARGGSRLAATA